MPISPDSLKPRPTQVDALALLDRYDGREDGMEALEVYLEDLEGGIMSAHIDFDSNPQRVALAAIEHVFVQIENQEDSPQHPRYLTPIQDATKTQ